jgi:2-phospho-L-lactate transferase/gluconeogenesis factor (CofD/UPF0052 family)
VALNLVPQPGETEGFSPHKHLEVLADHAPGLPVNVVLADKDTAAGSVPDLEKASALLGARLMLASVAADGAAGAPHEARHDPVRLSAAFRQIFEGVEGGLDDLDGGSVA